MCCFTSFFKSEVRSAAYADWCDGEPFGDKAEMEASDIDITTISAIGKGKRLFKDNSSPPSQHICDIEKC
jgi:hypothetical protein